VYYITHSVNFYKNDKISSKYLSVTEEQLHGRGTIIRNISDLGRFMKCEHWSDVTEAFPEWFY
jgi:hypothetical protein